MLPIREMFIQASRMIPYGIQGYHVEKKYVDNKSGEENSKIKKKQLKRGSYLEDYQKVHGTVPGPGVYNHAKNLWPQKSNIPRNKPADKKTYIDEIVMQCKKQKRPAPGQYKLQKSVKQQDQERKSLARRKTHHSDRLTYLDGIQYEATLTPGVGKYNTRIRPKSSSTYNRKDKPEDWRKKHDAQSKKKPPKTPDMGSYNPKQMKSYERRTTKEGEWNRRERFEKDKSGSGLGPGKYIPIDDWTHKNEVINSRPRPRSAYYN